jgi:hypothetical protein
MFFPILDQSKILRELPWEGRFSTQIPSSGLGARGSGQATINSDSQKYLGLDVDLEWKSPDEVITSGLTLSWPCKLEPANTEPPSSMEPPLYFLPLQLWFIVSS